MHRRHASPDQPHQPARPSTIAVYKLTGGTPAMVAYANGSGTRIARTGYPAGTSPGTWTVHDAATTPTYPRAIDAYVRYGVRAVASAQITNTSSAMITNDQNG